MPAPKLVNMFAVPFAFGHYAAHEPLDAALKHLLFELEKSGDAANPRPLTQRNAAVFESHFNLFRDPNPAIQELKAFCWDQMLNVIGQLNGYDIPTIMRLEIYNDCWFHISRRGGFFGLHNCVDPGRHDPGKPDSGLLSFVNPMLITTMHMDAGIAKIPLPYGNQIASVRLNAGELVIFPSWVLHDVKPFEGDGERITIAFNCWFNLPDAK
jgi:hypothetical protein